MAKSAKTAARKPVKKAAEEPRVAIMLRIDEETRRQLKIKAARLGVSLQSLVHDAVMGALKG